MAYKGTCIICGREFIGKQPHQKTCSRECRKKWDIIRWREWHRENRSREPKQEITKNCAVCKKEFKTKNDARIYCSQNCRRKAESIRRALNRVQKREVINKKVCKKCGKELVTKGKYCPECVQQLLSERKISLCWDCVNAYADRCEWIGKLEKVWDEAIEKETPRSDGRDVYTIYTVIKCKRFVPEEEKAVG